jgi:pSer/pThr/pTyr-binding forkhead associated (FHA) protein
VHEITLAVTNGLADKPDYTLTLDRINVGRCAEVRDSRNRLLRTNHVAFSDGAGPINETVSRAHAHIDCGESGEYRLFDDRSSHGTSIVRIGRTISVPAGSRGVRLQSGDEVVLGEARLRVKFA